MTLLVCRAKFEKLLNNIVAEDISHETVSCRQDFLKDQLFLCGGGALQLLLDEAGAVLVLAELHYMVGKVTQLQIRITIVPEYDKLIQLFIIIRELPSMRLTLNLCLCMSS